MLSYYVVIMGQIPVIIIETFVTHLLQLKHHVGCCIVSGGGVCSVECTTGFSDVLLWFGCRYRCSSLTGKITVDTLNRAD